MKKINLLLFISFIFSINSNFTKLNHKITDVNSVGVDNLIINATFEHISVHLNILGDDNLNSSLEIEYRLSGTTTYLPAADAMRAFPSMIVDGSALNMNFHAGSMLFLQPNSLYDVRIILIDPDGGGSQINRTVLTKAFPKAAFNGNVKWVIPGNGGGSGEPTDPYQGLQTAINTANPGDIFEVFPGEYSPFTIDVDGTLTMPITIRSYELHNAIIDGGNTNAGIVTVGNFSDSTKHIIIDGFTIRNGARGIDAQNTQYLTIQNNDIQDVDYGFVNRRENGWEHDQYIFNNKWQGRTTWPGSGIPAERGIDIRGNRDVVAYNTIFDFADGVSTDGPPYKTYYALDIHHNDINRIVDDLIEVDGMVSNCRVYANRCFNGRAGISVAPVFGGPAYVFRNVFMNMENSTFKMNRSPAGLYMVHNTGVKSDNGLSSPIGWQNTFIKNNAILATRYCLEEFGLVNGSNDDYDYNAYYSTRNGTGGGPWFKWNNLRFNNVPALQSGTTIETNGIAIDPADFESLSMPINYNTEIITTNVDLNPVNNAALINAGLALNNINLPFVIDGNPDIGAIERGGTIILFGHDFIDLCNRVGELNMTWQGTLNNSWFEPANWTPCVVPNETSIVTIPNGLTNYPKVNTPVHIKRLIILNGAKVDVYGNDNVFLIEE
jgi:hypothetical protein